MSRRNELQGYIERGMPVPDLQANDLTILQDLAAWYLDSGPPQPIKAQIALMEAEKANKLEVSS